MANEVEPSVRQGRWARLHKVMPEGVHTGEGHFLGGQGYRG